MKKLFILIISTATILTACKKEQNAEPEPKLPTVITQAISNITTNSAQSGGNIISEGSSGIIDKGVVWGTVPNPLYGAPGTYATNDGAGLGVYTSSIETDVTPGTTYYVKAYARNQIGYAYGEELSFTTLSLSAPTLTTGPITSITDNSAFCAGSITSDGGSAIITRGICWSTSPNPTISNSTTNDGSGIGTFVGYLTGNSNTLYYVRAYATNSSGTGYGNELSFTTKLGIGDSYQGGVIAYLLQPSDIGYDANIQHGLIAAPNDQSTSIPWAVSLTTTGATGLAIGTGQTNTNAIVANQSSGSYAAKICDDLVLGGYSDWYLPSMYELEKLYINRIAIGGFSIAFYWSSSEDDANGAWLQSFNSNSQTIGIKTNLYYVRAIRSF